MIYIFYFVTQKDSKSEYSNLKQSSVIKFLVAEKCKPCEIYRKMCDVYTEAGFSQKNMFTNGQNMGLPLWTWIKKNICGMEMNWLSSKEKVLGAALSKESYADSLLGHERTHHYWFSWKWCNYKQCFLLQIA